MSDTIVPKIKTDRIGPAWEALNNVLDPELGVGIVDLGLIYDIALTNGNATITMTLTSMGCPAGAEIMRRIHEEMEKVDKIASVSVDLVWEPVWGPDRVDPDIRALIFGA